MNPRTSPYLAALAVLALAMSVAVPAGAGLTEEQLAEQTRIRCGNLVYSGEQSSVCFADHFLSVVAERTGIDVDPHFSKLRLDNGELFSTPFCIFSGTGSFTLNEAEIENLRKYVTNGGFIVASPGCSDSEWIQSFRRAFKTAFPDHELEKIPMDHTIFSVVNEVTSLNLRKRTGRTELQGLHIDGRLALVFSPDGLNDVARADGCCCCGGAEIAESVQVNVNLFVYSLLY
ncbi:hypothetical protein BH23VER1_BH23VER1_01140 [soil metagenome]